MGNCGGSKPKNKNNVPAPEGVSKNDKLAAANGRKNEEQETQAQTPKNDGSADPMFERACTKALDEDALNEQIAHKLGESHLLHELHDKITTGDLESVQKTYEGFKGTNLSFVLNTVDSMMEVPE